MCLNRTLLFKFSLILILMFTKVTDQQVALNILHFDSVITPYGDGTLLSTAFPSVDLAVDLYSPSTFSVAITHVPIGDTSNRFGQAFDEFYTKTLDTTSNVKYIAMLGPRDPLLAEVMIEVANRFHKIALVRTCIKLESLFGKYHEKINIMIHVHVPHYKHRLLANCLRLSYLPCIFYHLR